MASGRDEEANQIVLGYALNSHRNSYQELKLELADISEDRTTLINVVKALGEYLTSEESETLQKGLRLK